jgi:hypothetical protein
MTLPLTLPAIGSTNWGTAVNANWTLLNSLMQGGGKNLIHNGNFDLWQRNITFGNLTGIYTADRWKAIAGTPANGSVVASGSVSSPFNAAKTYLLECTTGGSAYIEMGQQIEYQDFYLMLGVTMTVSFWAKALANTSTSKALTLQYRVNTTTTNGSTIFNGSITPTIYSISLSTSWQLYTQQITIPTSALGFALEIGLFGSPVNGDGFYIAQVQLEPGSVNTPFMYEPFAVLLQKCQRFYEKSYDLATVPGTVTEIGSIRGITFSSSTWYNMDLRFKVTKYIAPSTSQFKFYSTNSGASGMAYDFNVPGDVVINIVNQGMNGTFFYNAANTWGFIHVQEFQYSIDVDF